MKVFFVFVLILWIPSPSHALQTMDVNVPCKLNEVGNIRLTYRTSALSEPQGRFAVLGVESVTAHTNLETRQGHLWTHDHTIILKAKCDNPLLPNTSHLTFVTDNRGVITHSAVWLPDDSPMMLLTLKLYAFALGVILALAFMGGIKSYER